MNMKLHDLLDVDLDEDKIEAKADSRGRVNLGSEYAGEKLTVLVVERGEE